MNFPHKGQWRGALRFSLIFVRINGWANNREAGHLRRYRAHYDVMVMTMPVFWVYWHANIDIAAFISLHFEKICGCIYIFKIYQLEYMLMILWKYFISVKNMHWWLDMCYEQILVTLNMYISIYSFGITNLIRPFVLISAKVYTFQIYLLRYRISIIGQWSDWFHHRKVLWSPYNRYHNRYLNVGIKTLCEGMPRNYLRIIHTGVLNRWWGTKHLLYT